MRVEVSSLFRLENYNQKLIRTRAELHFTPPDGRLFLHQDINLTNFHIELQ